MVSINICNSMVSIDWSMSSIVCSNSVGVLWVLCIVVGIVLSMLWMLSIPVSIVLHMLRLMVEILEVSIMVVWDSQNLLMMRLLDNSVDWLMNSVISVWNIKIMEDSLIYGVNSWGKNWTVQLSCHCMLILDSFIVIVVSHALLNGLGSWIGKQ